MELYFDNAATTPMSPKSIDSYIHYAHSFPGNPSSNHRLGEKAKEELEKIREDMARLLEVESSSLIFTSGATEAISLFFSSLLWLERGRIIISRIEHEAVSSWSVYLKKLGWDIVTLKAKGGFVSKEDLLDSLSNDTRAVFIMSVNNVVGAIEPIEELVGVVREYERKVNHHIYFFSDSVQALGKTDLELKRWDVDGASFSSHKINGPRGVGLLYAKNPNMIRPLAKAGGQENGHRGGTENLPGIAAFDTALNEWFSEKDEIVNRAKEIKELLSDGIRSLNLRIFSPQNSSPFILSFEAPLPSEVFTRILMDRGVCVSAGSACSNNSRGKTVAILEAMGIRNQSSRRAIRISWGRMTKLEEAERLLEILKEVCNGSISN